MDHGTMTEPSPAPKSSIKRDLITIVLAFLAAPAISGVHAYHLTQFAKSFLAEAGPNNPIGMMALLSNLDRFLVYQYIYIGLTGLSALFTAFIVAANTKLRAKFGLGSIIIGLVLGALSFFIAYVLIIYGTGIGIAAK